MKKKIAVFDMDDVIVSTIDGIIELIWKNFNIKMELDDFINFDFDKNPKIAQKAEEITNLIRTNEFFGKRSPRPGALSSLKLLSEKYIIIISTARPKNFRQLSHDWCKNFSIDFKKVYCGDHKPDVILKEKADFFIDDSLYQHEYMFQEDIYSSGIQLQQILVDMPWNKNFHDKRVQRSCGWIPDGKNPTILDIML